MKTPKEFREEAGFRNLQYVDFKIIDILMKSYAEHYHASQTEMPSDEDTLKYFYHIGGRDKLMNINLKNKVTFGDRLEEFKQNSASQTEMPSDEEIKAKAAEKHGEYTRGFFVFIQGAEWLKSLQQENNTEMPSDEETEKLWTAFGKFCAAINEQRKPQLKGDKQTEMPSEEKVYKLVKKAYFDASPMMQNEKDTEINFNKWFKSQLKGGE